MVFFWLNSGKINVKLSLFTPQQRGKVYRENSGFFGGVLGDNFQNTVVFLGQN